MMTAGRDPNMFKVAARHSVPIVLMHMRGTPADMNTFANYPEGEELTQIASELKQKIQVALEAGIFPWHIITDPGIGFAKKLQHNLRILKDLRNWPKLTGNYPYLIGTSRKRFVGTICNQPDPKKRVWGTACTVAAAVQAGVHIVRSHDVFEISQVIKMGDAIWKQIGFANE